MPVPVVKMDGVFVALLPTALSDSQWEELKTHLAGRVATSRVLGVVIDVSQMDTVDSYACRVLRDLVGTLALRGSRAVIVGISPEVAISMVLLGQNLAGSATALDVDEGIEKLKSNPPERDAHAQ